MVVAELTQDVVYGEGRGRPGYGAVAVELTQDVVYGEGRGRPGYGAVAVMFSVPQWLSRWRLLT